MPLNPIITGATGMLGKAVLIECLESPDVENILVVGRRSCNLKHSKLIEIIHNDFLDFSAVESSLAKCNACFYCLGTSSVGMSEADYSRITHDYAISLANSLLRRCKDMTFCFTSGAGTDSSGKSRTMWARVKGKAENSLNEVPFTGVYHFRPAYIQPMKGIAPSWKAYKILSPIYPALKLMFPKYTCTSVQFGRAMINVALNGYERKVLESRDIEKAGG